MTPRKPISHIIAGLMISSLLVILTIGTRYASPGQQSMMQTLAIVIMVGGIVAFVNLYGKAKNNQVTFGNLFVYGFKITAIITLVVILCNVVFYLSFPELKAKILEASRQTMVAEGKKTDAEIEEVLKAARNGFWVYMAGSILFIYAIIGAVASLAGAAVTKKVPVNPVDQLDS